MLTKEHYHGPTPMPGEPASRTGNLAGKLVQATIGDFVTEKPPGKVSETLRVGKGTPFDNRPGWAADKGSKSHISGQPLNIAENAGESPWVPAKGPLSDHARRMKEESFSVPRQTTLRTAIQTAMTSRVWAS